MRIPLLLAALLPALGEYFQPPGTVAVSIDGHVEELGGKTTTTKKVSKTAGYDVDNIEDAHLLVARLNARFRLGVPSDDLHAAGVLVHINDQTVVHEVFGPIGGMGASGNGARSGGPSMADEYSQWQWITVNSQIPEYPF